MKPTPTSNRRVNAVERQRKDVISDAIDAQSGAGTWCERGVG